MPITRFLQSLSGTCRHCNQPAGLLQRTHTQCHQTHQTSIQEMTQLAALAAHAAGTSGFNKTPLRNTLQAIAQHSRATGQDIKMALEQHTSPVLRNQ